MDWLIGIAPQLGFGGVAGAIVGYAAKKLTKAVAFTLGVVFILLQGLAYIGWITIDWYAIEQSTTEFWQGEEGLSQTELMWEILVANLPFAGGFAVGFPLGFRKG